MIVSNETHIYISRIYRRIIVSAFKKINLFQENQPLYGDDFQAGPLVAARVVTRFLPTLPASMALTDPLPVVPAAPLRPCLTAPGSRPSTAI
jgi:hypothetical protein